VVVTELIKESLEWITTQTVNIPWTNRRISHR